MFRSGQSVFVGKGALAKGNNLGQIVFVERLVLQVKIGSVIAVFALVTRSACQR